MQINYRRLVRFNMLFIVNANNSEITITNENFLEHYETKYKYEDLSENTVRGRTGESEWTTIGWTLLVIPFFVYLFVMTMIFPDYRRHPIAIGVYVTLMLLGLVAFAMRMIKEDWIWFHNKDNSVAFAIKIGSKQREETEALIEFILRKIKESKKKKSSRKT